jgi:hypothetical protein
MTHLVPAERQALLQRDSGQRRLNSRLAYSARYWLRYTPPREVDQPPSSYLRSIMVPTTSIIHLRELHTTQLARDF